jgi:Protein of unknown function (DUF1348)
MSNRNLRPMSSERQRESRSECQTGKRSCNRGGARRLLERYRGCSVRPGRDNDGYQFPVSGVTKRPKTIRSPDLQAVSCNLAKSESRPKAPYEPPDYTGSTLEFGMFTMTENRASLPSLTHDTEVRKVRGAERGWNACSPEPASHVCAPDRSEHVLEPGKIIAFLTRKWTKELSWRFFNDLWGFAANRITVGIADKWYQDSGS